MRARGTVFVLAGGGSHGAAQVGMLRALVEAGVRPDFVVGTSVGAINGVFFAADPTPTGVERLGSIWKGISRRHVYPLDPLTWMLGLLGRRSHLIPSAGLRTVLRRNLPVGRLEDTRVQCAVIAADVRDGSPVVLSRGPAVEAVLASASLPVLLPPVELDDRELMDGAIASNAAISSAVALGAERVIVLPTGFACAASDRPRNAIAMGLHVVSLLLARQLAGEIEQNAGRVPIRVVPPLCPMPVSSYDFSRGAWLLERSAQATAAWLAQGGLVDGSVPASLRPHRHDASA